MSSRLVQIDVDLGMSEVLVATRASNNTLVGFDDWHLGDHVNSPVLVDDFGGIGEAHVSVIIFVVSLKARHKQTVIQSNYNNK